MNSNSPVVDPELSDIEMIDTTINNSTEIVHDQPDCTILPHVCDLSKKKT